MAWNDSLVEFSSCLKEKINYFIKLYCMQVKAFTILISRSYELQLIILETSL
jgi:hypothetical protein